jgi:PAS domain S-box-containing protein
MSEGMFTVDEKQAITSFNKAAEEITGFRASETIGRPCFSVLRSELCGERCPMKAGCNVVENAHVAAITKDGDTVPLSLTAVRLKDDRGNPVGALILFSDLSEVERLTEQNISLISTAMSQDQCC